MFYFLLTFILLIGYSIQSQTCSSLHHDDCIDTYNCKWEETLKQCQSVEYSDLGASRHDLPHYIIFHRDDQCDYSVGDDDFEVTKTFVRGFKFKSWCRLINIYLIKVKDQFYDGPGKIKDYENQALIIPKPKDGCALLYEKKFYRGDSWEMCRPTKLNGQRIKSLIVGPRAQLSLYAKDTDPINHFQQIKHNDVGRPKINARRFEYVLVEKHDDW